MEPKNRKSLDYHIDDNNSFAIPDATSRGKDMSYLDDRVGSWRNQTSWDAASALPWGIGETIDAVRAGSAFADGEVGEGLTYIASALLPVNLSLGAGALKAKQNLVSYDKSFFNQRAFENMSNTVDGFYSSNQAKRIAGIKKALVGSASDYFEQRMNPVTSALSKSTGLNRGNYRRLNEYLTRYRELEATGTKVGNVIKVTPEVNMEMARLAKQMEGEWQSVFATAKKFGKEIPKELDDMGNAIMKKLPDGEFPASYFGSKDVLKDPVFYQMEGARMHSHSQALYREQAVQDLIHYAKYGVDETTLAKKIPGAKINPDGTYELIISPKGKPNFFIGGFNGKVIVNPKAKGSEDNIRFFMNDEFDFGSGKIRDITNAGQKHSFVTVGDAGWHLKYLDEQKVIYDPTGDLLRDAKEVKVRKPREPKEMLPLEIEDVLKSDADNLKATYFHKPKADAVSSLLELYNKQAEDIKLSNYWKEALATVAFTSYRVPSAVARNMSRDEVSVAEQAKKLGVSNNPTVVAPNSNPGLLNFMK